MAMPRSATNTVLQLRRSRVGLQRHVLGSDNANATFETYEGRGGNDSIDGRGGFDRADYNNDPTTTSGITVHLAAGTVTGDATVGTDTIRIVEAVRGTNFDDIFDATGFGRRQRQCRHPTAPSTTSTAWAATTHHRQRQHPNRNYGERDRRR